MSGSISNGTTIAFTGSIVTYPVLATGVYDIVAYGAQGGTTDVLDNPNPGGLGAEIGGDVTLTAGETLQIAVGGAGTGAGGSSTGGGGGGGSFVVGPNNQKLMIAGGGGGAKYNASGQPGLAGPSGGAGMHGGAGGTNGNGGSAGGGYEGGGGGGFSGNGGSAQAGAGGGASFANGLAGGSGGADGFSGGFGGGGGGGFQGGGGGGGYSGGGGAGTAGGYNYGGAGGGGGSFDSGANQVLVAGENSGNGSVVITPLALASTISGTVANQATTDEATIKPFGSVVITDPNSGSATETVTVTPSSTANGALSDPNAATDHGTLSNGVYTVSGTAAAVTADLDGLVFTPTAHEVAPGQTATTGFKISDTNSAAQTTTDSTTSVAATALDNPPTLSKPVLNYTVSEGQTLQGLYAQILANANDVDAGGNASLTISSIGQSNTMGFLYSDPTDQLLTYTASGYNSAKPTDSFTYTVSDGHGGTSTGTVDIAITGPSESTQVGASLTANGPNQRLIGAPGNDTLRTNGPNNLVFGGAGNDTITTNGPNDGIYGGTGTNSITVNGPRDQIVLQQGGTDQITGFNLHNGDTLDLTQVLAESQINLGGDFSKLGNYVSVTDSGSNASLSFNPNIPGGSASTLAVLNGVGPNTTLSTLINDHALTI